MDKDAIERLQQSRDALRIIVNNAKTISAQFHEKVVEEEAIANQGQNLMAIKTIPVSDRLRTTYETADYAAVAELLLEKLLDIAIGHTNSTNALCDNDSVKWALNFINEHAGQDLTTATQSICLALAIDPTKQTAISPHVLTELLREVEHSREARIPSSSVLYCG